MKEHILEINMNEITKKHTSYILTRWLFIRLLGIIYFIAFISLHVQILGLVGSDGILPAHDLLNWVQQHHGIERYWLVPTVFWINSSDISLSMVCILGAVLSVFAILGFAPTLILFCLWALYLSLTVVGQDFLEFQWDALLLEVGIISIFFAERHVRPRFLSNISPSIIVLWLLRAILFKLMLSSGLVKLLSGDPTWRNLTALTYHYWTQPLPNVISWYFFQLPFWFHQVSCFGMFFVELVVPFFIFMGRTMRIIAFWNFVGLQIFILLTGNYCFFNLLAILLCLTLLDDSIIQRFLPRRLVKKTDLRFRSPQKTPVFEKIVIVVIAGIFILVHVADFIPWQMSNNFIARSIQLLVNGVAPLRSINHYGLFAVMTKKRPEIIFEGSQDGKQWRTYEFYWKPGRLDRAPGWVAPHQPRLDWQMWFAALSTYRYNSWVIRFMYQLLGGSKSVSALLAYNPFPDKPPQYVRAVVFDYNFTDWETRKKTGHWWKRTVRGLYCPVLNRKY